MVNSHFCLSTASSSRLRPARDPISSSFLATACMRPDESRQPQTSFAHTLQQPSVTQINHLTYVCRKLPWIYGNSCGNKWLVRYTFPSSDVFKSSNLIIIGCLKWTFFRHASMHETHNLHARRWWLEFALSIFHQCCTALVLDLMFPCVSCHQVLTECTRHADKPRRLSTQTGWAHRGGLWL